MPYELSDLRAKKGAILATKDGKTVATLPFNGKGTNLNLDYVGVDKEFRGTGLATKALKLLRENAKKEGFKQLGCEITWTGAYRMMKKVFGEPTSIEDPDFGEQDEEHLFDVLPFVSPEDEHGTLSGTDFISVWWQL